MTNATVQPILVVDDDAPIRELIVQALTEEGYAVHAAPDGKDALAHLSTGAVSPRMILLDWRMPTPGGVFAREYRALPSPHAPILVLTGDGDAVDAMQTIGARGFLCKPFDLYELLDFVRRIAGPPGTLGPTLGPAIGLAQARESEEERDADGPGPAPGNAAPHGRSRAAASRRARPRAHRRA